MAKREKVFPEMLRKKTYKKSNKEKLYNKESGYWVSADNYISFGQRILGKIDLNIHTEKRLKKQAKEIFRDIFNIGYIRCCCDEDNCDCVDNLRMKWLK